MNFVMKNLPFALTCLLSYGAIYCATPPVINLPIIKNIKWGEIVVSQDGKETTYAGRITDAVINPNGSQPWDWSITGMHHRPGVQIADVQKFINLSKVDVVILTRGMDRVLQVPQGTVDWLKQQGKQVYVGQTKEMVKKYNELVAQGKKVGGLFHSTC